MTHPLLNELERVEREAWADLAAAAPPPFAAAVGLEAGSIGPAFFFMAARIAQFQFNWLSGAGLNGDDGRSIDTAVARFRAGAVQKFFIQIPPGPHAAACEARARGAGLAPHPLAWAKFHRLTADAPGVETALSVREVGVEERDVFAATALAGFGMPPPMAAWLGRIVGRPGWHTYVTYDGDVPAGAAALFVSGDFAWAGIGATRPEQRRKGIQTTLLARRIADAARFGARHAVTETGVPQPGQPAPSFANILKAGFTVAYVRPNWALPPAP